MSLQWSTSPTYPSLLSRDAELPSNGEDIPRGPEVPYDQDPYGHGGDEQERPRERAGEPRSRLLPAIGFLLGSAVLGLVLALVWRNAEFQHWSTGKWWMTVAAQSTKNAGGPTLEDQLAHIIQELDVLKKTTTELGAAQQQMAATMASLQAGQQELQQRVSSTQMGSAWYFDPAMLKSHLAKKFITFPQQTSTPRVRADSRLDTRNGVAPLSLVSPER